MDKKTKILFSVFFVLLVVTSAVTYKRTMIDRNYEVFEEEVEVDEELPSLEDENSDQSTSTADILDF
jgi:hypothetical protein